jgi:NADPH:quinone reductase
MRALVLREFSGPEGVVLDEVAPPDDDRGDGGGPARARIEVHAAGVSFADVLITRGQYQLRPTLPFVPGLEVAGIVRRTPSGTGFAVGDRVAAFMFGGAFAEEAAADPATMVRLPGGLGFPEAAGFVVNYQTAWFALARRARLQPGETVLVQGAGGGLGVAVIQVARALGARVVGVAGTAAKAAMAEAAGADRVVSAGDGWADAVRAATGPVDVVVDPVGGDRFDDSLRLLRPEGRLVVVGFAGGDIPRVKVNRLLLRNISVLGAAWREFLIGEPGFVAEAGAALEALIAGGRLTPLVGATYPLEDGARALQDLAERRAVGKLVLTVR